MNKSKITHRFIIGTFVSLYVVVSLISTIHVIDFFRLSNPNWLAVSLAIAFEIGAAASLAALIALQRVNKWMVWCIFILLAGMQMMGNTYYAFTNLHDFQGWSELFGLNEEELIYQKRILSVISGAILPLIALGFIKSLVDYINPRKVNGNEFSDWNAAKNDGLDGSAISFPISAGSRNKQKVKETAVPELTKEGEAYQENHAKINKPNKSDESEGTTNPQLIPGVN